MFDSDVQHRLLQRLKTSGSTFTYICHLQARSGLAPPTSLTSPNAGGTFPSHVYLCLCRIISPARQGNMRSFAKFSIKHLSLQELPHLQRYPRRPELVSIPIQFRQLHLPTTAMSPLKRKAEKPDSPRKPKKSKVVIPEYHLAPSRQDENGAKIWPARIEQINRAREIIKKW